MTQWDNMLKDIRKEYESQPTKFLQQRMISRTIHPPGWPCSKIP